MLEKRMTRRFILLIARISIGSSELPIIGPNRLAGLRGHSRHANNGMTDEAEVESWMEVDVRKRHLVIKYIDVTYV